MTQIADKILYVCGICPKEKFEKLFLDTKIKPSQAVQKYHSVMIDGLIKNKACISVLSILPVSRSTSDSLFVFEKREFVKSAWYNYVPIINIPIIKNIVAFIASFFYSFFKFAKNRETVVICDILNITVAIAVVFASKIAKTKSIGIVTDVPGIFADKDSDYRGIKKIIKTIITKTNKMILNKFDSYVFLTPQMNDLINIKNKPYVVIEGQVDINMCEKENLIEKKYDKKVCIYAGGLQKIYGIKKLCDAFLDVDIENSKLHIYGDGDFKDELIEICKQTDKVKYFGVKPNDFVVKEQLKATLLINPRPTNEEYTKYSFPSKNMEYMVSGTPTLTTRLPGMPKEYYDYVYLIDHESVDGLVKTLQQILSKPKIVLHKFGLKSKEWVIVKKNNIVQARKILKMIKELRSNNCNDK